MAEKIITLTRRTVCDLCGGVIRSGSKAIRIDDDFCPGLVFFEHLNCPEKPTPKKEKKDASNQL